MTVNKSGDKAVPGIMVQDAERRIRDDDFAVNNNDGISLTAQSQDALVDDAKLTVDEDFHCCLGTKQIDVHLGLSTEKMFNLLFTDCQFYRTYCQQINVFNPVATEWSDVIDQPGSTTRTLTYNVLIKSPIGNRTAGMTERQVCSRKDEVALVMDCYAQNPNIPYGNNFCLCNHYRISCTQSPLECRFTLHTEIQYKKAVWGLVKSIIEKTVTVGAREGFTTLETLLKREVGMFTQPVHTSKSVKEPSDGRHETQPRRRGTAVRRRRPNTLHWQPNHASRLTSDVFIEPPTITPGSESRESNLDDAQSLVDSRNEEELSQSNSHLVLTVICVMLLMLFVGNAFLFYTLWQLEDCALSHQDNRLMETGAARYALLTADQRRELIVRLQQVLDRSLRIIDEVKLSLAHLHLDCASELDRLTHE